VPPASSNEIFNATYLPTKLSGKGLNLLFMLHQTVSGVPSASSDEKKATYIATNYLVNG